MLYVPTSGCSRRKRNLMSDSAGDRGARRLRQGCDRGSKVKGARRWGLGSHGRRSGDEVLDKLKHFLFNIW